MKYWVKVRVQCDAQEVLGVKCEKTMEVEVLHRVGGVEGGATALFGGRPVPTIDIADVRPVSIDPGWAVAGGQRRTGPLLFCSAHAQAGLAKIDGTVE